MLGAPPTNRFGRDAHAVRIENIAHTVGRHEVIDLFSNLIGQVRRCEEHITDEDGRYMDMSFFSRDCARKALCMSGYTVSGVPLSVSAIAPAHSQRRQDRFNQADDRRNLYVLGLPFNLTKTEFTELFGRYGTVAHSVILATVDNASRRRGFIVMSTHTEAKAAMDNLSRAEIKNHVIDVSWAVVQRSQGFLDGGDRTMPSPTEGPTPLPSGVGAGELTRSSSPFGGYVHPKRDQPPRGYGAGSGYGYESPGHGSFGGRDSPYGPSSHSRPPSYGEYPRPSSAEGRTTLLVTNVPALIFSSEADLRSLFWPYGEVRKLEVVRNERPSTSSSVDTAAKPVAKPVSSVEEGAGRERQETKRPEDIDLPEKLSVIVEYATAHSAAEARLALHGQTYGSCAISVEYHGAPISSADSPTRSIPSLASSISSVPSSASGSFPDISSFNLRDSVQDRAKRHSFADFDKFSHVPTSAGPGMGWHGSHQPHLELTPSSPPHSARSLGGWPAADRFGLPPPRGFDSPYGRDAFSAPRRGAMYDRSNNTSPFSSAVFLPNHRPYSPGPGGYARAAAYDEALRRERESENRFGAIARPLSAVDRRAPGAPGDAVHVPSAPASNGNSPPRAIPRSKYEELRSEDFALANPAARPSRAFNSMPDVFDFPGPVGQVPART